MTNTNRGRCRLGIVAVLLTLAAGLHAGPPDGAQASRPDLRVVITGANRGLGLEFARQFHAAGARVIGTARRPDAAEELKALGVRVEQLDVTDAESVARLASRLGNEPVDIVINNAGIGGRHPSIEQIDADTVDRIFQVNCLGPMRVTQALLPALRKGDRKLVVNITSRLGSIELNEQGGYYGYRESKAALNMFSRSLAGELSAEGFTCVAISPGWVRTDMGGSHAPLSPAESIQGMIAVINGLTTKDSGAFFDYRGQRLPW
jgi:NAD(P)-dependent dehydrogenase (short-subunit alcohol dehydrogenase family)